MEQIGGAAAARFSRRRRDKPPERYLGVPQPQSPAAAPPVELSEDDIFATPSGCSSPPPAQRNSNLNAAVAARSINRNHYGILAALNGSLKSSSGSEHEVRPVFNHKASIAASLSSSSSISTSPASPFSSRLMIPRPPPLREDLGRVHHQSVPVNIPAMPQALRMKATEADDAVSEGEDDDDDDDGVRLPPHELVDSRHSPMLSCSVLEGAGRTLKGRDLRQVRNAIWRRTGFVD